MIIEEELSEKVLWVLRVYEKRIADCLIFRGSRIRKRNVG